MIKFLFKVAIVVLLAVLVYNYFFGSEAEKETSKNIYSKAKDLTASVWDLAKSEKTKFEAGKYDKAIDKLNDVYDAVRKESGNMTEDEKEQLHSLEREKIDLERDVRESEKKDKADADKDVKSLDKKLFDLIKRTEELVGKTDKEE